MVDSQVSSIDLNVFGGPSRVDLAVDFGQQGVRGSRIVQVTGDPRLITTFKPADVIIYDVALNVKPSSPDYLTLYQKTGAGPEDWTPMAELFPNVYSSKKTLEFTSGTATTTIVLNDVFSITNYSVDNFMVQIMIEDTLSGTNRPVASSVSLSVAPSGEDQILTIQIDAIEYNPTGGAGGTPAWQQLSGNKTVHIYATVV